MLVLREVVKKKNPRKVFYRSTETTSDKVPHLPCGELLLII